MENKIVYLIALFLFLILFLRQNSAQPELETDFIKLANLSIQNYTSCEDFVANTNFDPKSVVNADWKIFYFWSNIYEDSYNLRFSLATKILIDRFRTELDDELVVPVNWTNAHLFMESSIDFSGLFVATNVSGIYTLIPSLAFEYNKLEFMRFALKVVEPGYLGVLNCKFRVCYALAPVDKIPHETMLEKEAQKLGFWNEFGHSYRQMRMTEPPNFYDPVAMDDDDEDENLELLHNENISVPAVSWVGREVIVSKQGEIKMLFPM